MVWSVGHINYSYIQIHSYIAMWYKSAGLTIYVDYVFKTFIQSSNK